MKTQLRQKYLTNVQNCKEKVGKKNKREWNNLIKVNMSFKMEISRNVQE